MRTSGTEAEIHIFILFFFFRYNLQTIKSTLLKDTIQFLVDSQACITAKPLPLIPEYFHPPERAPVPPPLPISPFLEPH